MMAKLRISLLAALLASCASGGNHAPVVEHGAAEKKPPVQVEESVTTVERVKKSVRPANDWRPQVYVVQKGDTLYGIAFNFGLDYREVAQINNLQNPDLIHVGQELRLFPEGTEQVALPKPVEAPKPVEIPVKEQPQVAMLPYSDQALAEIRKLQGEQPKPEQAAKVEPKPEIKPEPKPEPKVEPKPEAKPEVKEAVADAAAEDSLEWSMPTNGKVVAEFSESANRKGIDISGKQGQPVVASAAGKVVYSGSGLRGYGKLVIIKHNNTYLSAYAHNDQILVKEGQSVTKGQKIAEMGNTDADQVKLHFEIRKLGKPVDPVKYLPLIKS